MSSTGPRRAGSPWWPTRPRAGARPAEPVLVGVRSAADAAEVSGLLSEAGIAHEVLTADNPGQEARIMADAGRAGTVTVAAQMAGRGVDIVLGGPDGTGRAAVAGLGGLCVLGAGRPARRREEMHLRGRAGGRAIRGESKFFVCASDDWIKSSGGSLAAALLRRLTIDGQAVRYCRRSRSAPSTT